MSRVRGVARALGALWLLLGTALLLMPSAWVPADVANSDGIAHAAVFFTAVTLWTVALPGRAAWVVWAAALLAMGSEMAQAVLAPSRDAGWSDVAANLVGTAVGLGVGVALSWLIRHRETEHRPEVGTR